MAGKMSDLDTKVEVSLFIYGHDLDPALVTEKLGLTPEVAARRGATRHWQGKSSVQKVGVWGYKIKGAEVEPLVDQFIAALTPCDNILARLPAAEEGVIEIFISMLSDEGSIACEEELSVTQMKSLCAFGLPLRFTVYGTPPD
jgi:hypothetical protein